MNRLLLITDIFGLISNVILDYIFARLWQSTGIALATSAVYLCNLFILLFLLRRQVGKLDIFTPPPELLRAIKELSMGSLFSIPYGLRQWIVRLGIMLPTFAVGGAGTLWDSLYTLHAGLSSLLL